MQTISHPEDTSTMNNSIISNKPAAVVRKVPAVTTEMKQMNQTITNFAPNVGHVRYQSQLSQHNKAAEPPNRMNMTITQGYSTNVHGPPQYPKNTMAG